MIEVEKLTKYFGPVMAVTNISFQVGQNEIVGLLGNNGAGKTTIMRILTTYLPATSGRAKVAGHDVMTESMEVRKNIGYLPESVPLYPEMRVEEYLHYRAALKGVERKGRRQRIDYCLERCRVREVRRRLLGTLSKGYRQRVGLADCMLHNPPILILDEPTDGLDPLQKRETLATLKELGQSHTIMLSTHLLSEVEAICNRVVILNRGHLGIAKKLSELETEALIVVEVRGPSDQVANVLKSTDGVTHVTTRPEGDGLALYEVRTRGAQDLREALSRRIAEKGWPIRRLDLSRRRLEDRFMEVLRQQDPLAKVGAGDTAMTPAGPVTAS
ncbi:MAG TPA: ATP-binding cassette domain-containing protein [Gemmataceae bacterium]|nr:ATP-binding cassette domain-containing protein [Gemmataceae bacterium]